MHLEPFCISKRHRCSNICVSAECFVNNPFTCSECQDHHTKKCDIIPYKEFVKRIHLLQGLTKIEIVKYENYVENTFKTLIKNLQNEFLKFRDYFESINIDHTTKHLYNHIKKHREYELTGSFCSKIFKGQKRSAQNIQLKSESLLWSLSHEIIQIQQKIVNKLPYYYGVDTDFEEYKFQPEEKSELKDVQTQFLRYRQNLQGGLLENHIASVETLFGSQIYSAQCIFKASRQQFSAREFHRKCDGVKNTLVVAETEFKKIIGGFCPLASRSFSEWHYFEDPSEKTFIFSLERRFRGLKFSPFKKKFTVAMHQDYGPCFGEDIIIPDKSNRSKNCWSNFPDCYRCKEKEIPHTADTIRSFIGNEDHFKKFNIMEWEVYKISFNSSEQLEKSFMEEYRKI